ncbi:hypothetical protein ACFQ2K_48500 [Streptomyces sanglieri]|uniref:Uncharacterized protein n=1 Tax=Streptomyces sanglieri TaxID=193460 RepID=A0ABW2X8I4_9ACTN
MAAAPFDPAGVVEHGVGVVDAGGFEEDDKVMIGVGGAEEFVVAVGVCGPDGYGNVRNYVSRTLHGRPQPAGPRPPSARAVTRWILTHSDALAEGDRLQLKACLVLQLRLA